MPAGDGTGADLCRVADLEVVPAGDGLSLVRARDSGAAGYYRPDVLALLTSCREFAPIGQHVRDYLAGAGAGPGEAALHRELTRLRAAGFLVTGDAVRAGTAAGPDPGPIRVIGIPACDRPALLRRAVSGYAANCARHGRAAAIVVADDSAGPGDRADRRAMLAGLAGTLETDVKIRYAGLEEKSAFADRLARAGNIPAEVVRFGCLPAIAVRRGGGVTIGANRNALLLDTAGELLFSADDDTVCQLFRPPWAGPGLALDSDGDPLRRWFFACRDDAVAAAVPADCDVLGEHGRYLGRAPAALLAGAGPQAAGRSDPALLRRILSGPERIRVTANGMLGDCGWDNPDYYLLQNEPTFARLAGSAASFALARGGREVIQAVAGPTISGDASPGLAMCVGLDNTSLLPPFPPSGRAEEVTFGALLTRCWGAYAAHLPLLLRHDPPGPRQFAGGAPFVISPGAWLPSLLNRFDGGVTASPVARLRALGAFLGEVAALPGAEFEDLTRRIRWESMSALTLALEARLDGPDPPPAYWAGAARELMGRVRRAALVPVAEAYGAIGGRSALQDFLGQYGQLLTWWPAMVETARQLRATGAGLAVPPGG